MIQAHFTRILKLPKRLLDPLLLRFFFQQHVLREPSDDVFFPPVRVVEGLLTDIRNLTDIDVNVAMQELQPHKLLRDAARAVIKEPSVDEFKVHVIEGKIWVLSEKKRDGNSYVEHSRNIFTTPFLYAKLKRSFRRSATVSQRRFHLIAWCLLYRYAIFDDRGEHLSVHPATYKKLEKLVKSKHPLMNVVELFGSAINSNFEHYCSLYPDLEQHFGSLGSFFDFELDSLKDVLYTFNPPFDEYIMAAASTRLIKQIKTRMRAGRKGVIVVGFIPVWDSEGKAVAWDLCVRPSHLRHLRHLRHPRQTIQYGTYEAKQILNSSGLISRADLVCKENMAYYDWMSGKEIYAAHTHVFIMSEHSDLVQLIENMFRV
jgi:Phosphorylated CTD interacting factor 1 WW domain